jgi:hypothetical protein
MRERDPALGGLGIHQLHAYQNNKNINLPKLDKIITKNNSNNYKSPAQLFQERQ